MEKNKGNSLLHSDGSSTLAGSRAGVVLTNLDGDELEYDLHFNFEASNSEAEYETLTAAEPFKAISSLYPFSQWGMDIVGPFRIAQGQRKSLLVAVDYFSMWVEAAPLTRIILTMVVDFRVGKFMIGVSS
ncbi:hypothetical protein Sango_0653600 [Sesamum angolense]|uniref:Uncharacterized protein n=1 Tax=Sesamum angolense TaxID=2727404 RepID=A0AAE1X7E6_9LAMI|nr:hypothetical protein Sango_0653600 [Sesamum angolense]